MNRLRTVFSVALFSGACFASGCDPAGIDAVVDCGSSHIYVDCDQELEFGSVSGFIGVNSVAFSCNVPNAQTNTMMLTPDRTVIIKARIDYPVLGTQNRGAVLVTSTGDCDQIAPNRRASLGTITIEEFEPRSHIRGTFVSGYGKLHGTFDIKCGIGNVFCGTVPTPAVALSGRSIGMHRDDRQLFALGSPRHLRRLVLERRDAHQVERVAIVE
jgi:hypothetical protein